jgi:hypothetical protein
MYNLGCNQGHFDASYTPPVNSMVFLDFGGQNADGSGTLLIDNVTSVTNAQIEAMAEQFAYGYDVCTGADNTSLLLLGIGTNNSRSTVNASLGNTWAQVVQAVRSWDSATGVSAQVSALAANDIESWHNVTDTRAWVSGYSAINPAFYIDYGSADGCSETDHSNRIACAGGWLQSDYYYVAWEATPAQALPEIYLGGLANQWEMIDLEGVTHTSGGKILFYGPLDENDLNGGTYTASQAWGSLWTLVNRHSRTATNLIYSSEIHSAT